MENANKPKNTIVYIQMSKKLYIYIYHFSEESQKVRFIRSLTT